VNPHQSCFSRGQFRIGERELGPFLFGFLMAAPNSNKSARLYTQGLSCKQIAHTMGYTIPKVHEHLAKAGIVPDPAREVGKQEKHSAEHLIGVEGLPAEMAQFLRKSQPQTPEQEAEYDRELKAAMARVKEASIGLRVREVVNA